MGDKTQHCLAIRSSNHEALLYFLWHANEDQILHSPLLSTTDGRVQVCREGGKRGWVSLNTPACIECEANGASICVMQYDKAITSVFGGAAQDLCSTLHSTTE